jgi:hypothetical protein
MQDRELQSQKAALEKTTQGLVEQKAALLKVLAPPAPAGPLRRRPRPAPAAGRT